MLCQLQEDDFVKTICCYLLYQLEVSSLQTLVG